MVWVDGAWDRRFRQETGSRQNLNLEVPAKILKMRRMRSRWHDSAGIVLSRALPLTATVVSIARRRAMLLTRPSFGMVPPWRWFHPNNSLIVGSRCVGADVTRPHSNHSVTTIPIASGSNFSSFRRCNIQRQVITTRRYNFASTQYASCFTDIPTADVDKLRKDAVSYLDAMDKQSWYTNPVR